VAESKQLWDIAQSERSRNNLAAAAINYRRIVTIGHPSWAPRAATELQQLRGAQKKESRRRRWPTVIWSLAAVLGFFVAGLLAGKVPLAGLLFLVPLVIAIFLGVSYVRGRVPRPPS